MGRCVNLAKYILITLICLSSCTKSKVQFQEYRSELTSNPKWKDKQWSFSQEYKVVDWYHNQRKGSIKQFYYRSDEHNVKGVILLPEGFDESKKYPCLVYLRGGWGKYMKPSLFHFRWLSSFTKEGFIVITSMIRGSDNNKHLDELGGKDFDDVKNLFETMKSLPYIDSKNIQTLSWGSRGGVMSYLALKSDLHFNASLVINGASNLKLLEKTRPKGFFDPILKDAKDKETEYMRRSGLSWPQKIKKPVKIIHGQKNTNTSVEHALLMAEALKKNNKKYELKIYPNAGHLLKGTDHVKVSLDWFKKNLKEDK